MPSFHNLLFNPFYEKHDHKLVGNNRKILARILVNEVNNALDAKASVIFVLEGAVGVGKSFTLRDLSNRLKDPKQFERYGVASTPAIITVREQVKSAGRLPTVEVIKEWLKDLG